MTRTAKPTAFDKAFEAWVKRFDALEAAMATHDRSERKRLVQEARRQQNKAVPAAARAAVWPRRSILREGRRWFQQHGFDANIDHCIEHLRGQGCGIRVSRKGGKPRQLTPSAMRKILTKGLGIKGKPGRPRKS